MRALALLLVLLLAGCSTPGAKDGGSPTAPTASASRFLAPQVMGEGGPEPVLAFSPEGDRLYLAAQDPEGGGPFVWVSKDGGATFDLKRPTQQGGGEVDLAAGPNGAVYLTQLGARGNIVSVSRDKGETWDSAPLGGASQYFDREWLTVDANGRAYLVAREFGTTASAGVARSDDRGLTWPPRGKAWTALDEPGEANGPLVAVGANVHLAYICRQGEAVCVSTTRDGGLTWSRAVVASRGTNAANVYPALASVGGALLVAWADASDGALAVYTSRSSDAASWSAPQRASATGGTAALPWLASRGGATWLVYLRADEAMAATDCAQAQGARWIPTAQPLDAQGAPQGEPMPLTTEPAHVGIVSPPVGQSCSGGARDRNFGDFFTAAISPPGKLVVAWSADTGTIASTRDIVVRER
ncbi:MAG TPA: sialidase family protein [Candidatus Thermoplasmatota archaeon]|nr:sialidase family protein [Candidatus Thermoplasmatota archaeon]